MQRSDLKLVSGVVVALAVLGFMSAGVMAFAARRHFDELTQRLNASIAMYVDRAAPLLRDGNVDHEVLEQIAGHAMVVNPLARVYLLDAGGRVIGGGSGQVDPDPLRQWLAGHRGPLYGDDPAHPGGRSIFSVHPVRGGDGFVYVVLGGAQFADAGGFVSSSRILTVTLLLLTSIIALGGAIAVAIDRRTRRNRAQVDALRSLDQDRRRLFESIGHDLRTPLSAACGYLEMLEQDAGLSGDMRREYLSLVSAHCRRLARLVSQIFRLARLESPGMQTVLEPVSVCDLARDIGARFERDTRPGANRVVLDIEPSAPLVLADCELIETAIENLLDNAIRHGGPNCASRLAVEIHQASLVVSIQDSGRGFDPQAVCASTEGVQSRNGLGLIIVQRALGLLGSRLDIRSAPGCGTTMSFRLAVMNP
ncbi:MAG: ATP-binding protein [Gammaproteobacteria bacterium]|nr:ATP-binding protein [Gammaproteobacteria bacterium]